MIKWEYKVVRGDTKMFLLKSDELNSSELNDYGKKGWELVTSFTSETKELKDEKVNKVIVITLIFKRPIKI